MEPLCPLPHSQADAICPFPDSRMSSPRLPTHFLKIHFNIIPPPKPEVYLFPSGFPTKILCASLPSPKRVPSPAHLKIINIKKKCWFWQTAYFIILYIFLSKRDVQNNGQVPSCFPQFLKETPGECLVQATSFAKGPFIHHTVQHTYWQCCRISGMESNKVWVEACGNDNNFQKQNFPPAVKKIFGRKSRFSSPFYDCRK